MYKIWEVKTEWGRPAADEAAVDVGAFFAERLGIAAEERQLEVLRCEGKRVIVNCSRQWGKSTLAAGKALHRAVTRPGCLVLVASPTERQSAEFLRKVKALAGRCGERVRGDGDNRISLQLANGSRIVGLPGTEGTVRGFSAVSLLLIDEASRVTDEMYQALRPMLAVSDGDLWMMSTPMGKRGFFYETWAHGESWAKFATAATECPRISEAFLKEERRVQGDQWFRQEYLCEFVDNGMEVFGRELVEMALDGGKEWGMTGGMVTIGVDLGKRQDFTAIAVVERVERRVAWMPSVFEGFHVRYLERLPLGTAYTRVVQRVREIARDGRLGGGRKVVVDATGVGGPVVDMLRQAELGCGLTAVTITGGERAHGSGAWWNVPRQELIMGLRVLLENGELRISRELRESGRLVDELVRMDAGGQHDDLAMALGLACWGGRSGPAGEMGNRLPGI